MRGIPEGTQQLVLFFEDLDVPGPKPLMHTAAVIEPGVTELAAGDLGPAGATGVRLVKAFGESYVGPAPIAGHGPHHYRFVVLALDTPVPAGVADHNALLAASAGHVLARGDVTGTYER